MFIKQLFKRLDYTIVHFQRNYSNRNVIKLKERGMYQDMFPDIAVNEIIDLLNMKPQCVYAGFDPTASSLHVGNLLVLINLLHWQRGGHETIALIGGATAKIGDPSGRTAERDLLSLKVLEKNVKGIQSNIGNIFTNHEKYFWKKEWKRLIPVRILNNESWYNKLSAVDLISGAGRHLRLGPLLSRTIVQTRLATSTGMSFTEFSYQLFQSYDWLHLFKEYECRFQVGGNDQMGNIMSGYDLITRVCRKSVYGLTVPLITTEMGDKFGKSAGNAVWLSAEETPPFTYYQFWIRTTDANVEKFLKLFTFDTVDAISDIMRRHREKPELRLAQKKLAEQVTLLVHGEEGLGKALSATEALYEGSVLAMGDMKVEEIAQLFQGASIVQMLAEAGQNVLQTAMKAGCFATDNDAIRIITAGGFYINQERTTNPNEIINPSVHRLANNVSLLRVGKKNYYIVKWL